MPNIIRNCVYNEYNDVDVNINTQRKFTSTKNMCLNMYSRRSIELSSFVYRR